MSRSPFGAPVALWSQINRNYLPTERELPPELLLI